MTPEWLERYLSDKSIKKTMKKNNWEIKTDWKLLALNVLVWVFLVISFFSMLALLINNSST